MSSRAPRNKKSAGKPSSAHGKQHQHAADPAAAAALTIVEPTFGSSGPRKSKKAHSKPAQKEAPGADTAPEPAPVELMPGVALPPPPMMAADAEEEDAATSTAEQTFVWMLAFLLGRVVAVTTADGAVYEGVLSTAVPQKDQCGVAVVLRMASRVDSAKHLATKPQSLLAINAADVVQLAVRDVAEGDAAALHGPSMATDADIAATIRVEQDDGKLQAWGGYDGEPACAAGDEHLLNCDLSHAATGNWDPYRVNKERFGVDSVYDPTFYAPRVDRSTEEYRKAELEAKEIMKMRAVSVHQRLERGMEVDEDLTEEDLYGGVLREHDLAKLKSQPHEQQQQQQGKESKYVLPMLRNKQPQKKQERKADGQAEKKDAGGADGGKPEAPQPQAVQQAAAGDGKSEQMDEEKKVEASGEQEAKQAVEAKEKHAEKEKQEPKAEEKAAKDEEKEQKTAKKEPEFTFVMGTEFRPAGSSSSRNERQSQGRGGGSSGGGRGRRPFAQQQPQQPVAEPQEPQGGYLPMYMPYYPGMQPVPQMYPGYQSAPFMQPQMPYGYQTY